MEEGASSRFEAPAQPPSDARPKGLGVRLQRLTAGMVDFDVWPEP
jgi:hypothetical protein